MKQWHCLDDSHGGAGQKGHELVQIEAANEVVGGMNYQTNDKRNYSSPGAFSFHPPLPTAIHTMRPFTAKYLCRWKEHRRQAKRGLLSCACSRKCWRLLMNKTSSAGAGWKALRVVDS